MKDKRKVILITTILAHYLVFVSFLLTCLISFFFIPWFVAITLNALIVRVIFSSDECPLTTFENKYRTQLNLASSRGFLKDYILNPRKTFTNMYQNLKI